MPLTIIKIALFYYSVHLWRRGGTVDTGVCQTPNRKIVRVQFPPAKVLIFYKKKTFKSFLFSLDNIQINIL